MPNYILTVRVPKDSVYRTSTPYVTAYGPNRRSGFRKINNGISEVPVNITYILQEELPPTANFDAYRVHLEQIVNGIYEYKRFKNETDNRYIHKILTRVLDYMALDIDIDDIYLQVRSR